MMCEQEEVGHDLRVLVVENDPVSLLIIQQHLHQCNYRVTSCRFVPEAILMVMEDCRRFDLVISDIFLPKEDGLVLLKVVALHQSIPVVMMSWSAETDMVMRYIAQGACDFLIKPVTLKEMKTIWKHVIIWSMKGKDAMGGYKLSLDYSFGPIAIESSTKRTQNATASSSGEDQAEQIIDDVGDLKRPKLQWTRQLHNQFVSAVNTLGLNKAVPKKILETMNVKQLTRDQVASHLQKYRSFLKELSSSLPHGCDKFSVDRFNLELGANHKIDQAMLISLQQFIAMEKRNVAYQAEISNNLHSKGECETSAAYNDHTSTIGFDELVEQFGSHSPQKASGSADILGEFSTGMEEFVMEYPSHSF